MGPFFRRTMIFLAVALCLGQASYAQIQMIPKSTVDSLMQRRKVQSDPDLRFETLEIDFGKADEDGSPIEAVFRFTNTSGKEVRISSVTTSCSCLSAVMPQTVVKPGASAEIKAIYRQKGHPGRHDRYIYLYTSDAKGPHLGATLLLTGLVVTSSSEDGSLPVDMGFFRMSTSKVSFTKGVPSTVNVELRNITSSRHSLSVTEGLLPPGIKVEILPKDVSPLSGAAIRISYDGSKTVHVSDKGFPVYLNGTGLNRLNSKIDIFFSEQ